MMSCVFAAMIAAAIICGAANGSIAAVLDALTEGAANAVTLSLSLAGAYMLWMGLMGIARRAGLIDALSRAMRKPLALLFPNAGGAIAPITLNLAANFFGAGSAATPFGLEAMKELNAKAKYAGVATDEMCMFLALNASALELLPANVLALRTAAGSEDAYIVVLPTFIASVISFVSAAAICALLCRIMPQRPIGKGRA